MNTGGSSKVQPGCMHEVMVGYVERGEVPRIVTLCGRRADVVGTTSVLRCFNKLYRASTIGT